MTSENLDKKLEEAKFVLDAKFNKLKEDELLEAENYSALKKIKSERRREKAGNVFGTAVVGVMYAAAGIIIIGGLYLGGSSLYEKYSKKYSSNIKTQTQQTNIINSNNHDGITSKLTDNTWSYSNRKSLSEAIRQDYYDSIDARNHKKPSNKGTSANSTMTRSNTNNTYKLPTQVDPITGASIQNMNDMKDDKRSNTNNPKTEIVNSNPNGAEKNYFDSNQAFSSTKPDLPYDYGDAKTYNNKTKRITVPATNANKVEYKQKNNANQQFQSTDNNFVSTDQNFRSTVRPSNATNNTSRAPLTRNNGRNYAFQRSPNPTAGVNGNERHYAFENGNKRHYAFERSPNQSTRTNGNVKNNYSSSTQSAKTGSSVTNQQIKEPIIYYNGKNYNVNEASPLYKAPGDLYLPTIGHNYIINDTLFIYKGKTITNSEAEYIFYNKNCVRYKPISPARYNNLYRNRKVVDVTEIDTKQRELNELKGSNGTRQRELNELGGH